MLGSSHRGIVLVVVSSVLDQVVVRKVFVSDLGFAIADGVQTAGCMVAVFHLELVLAFFPLVTRGFSCVVITARQRVGFYARLDDRFSKDSSEIVISHFMDIVLALGDFNAAPKAIVFVFDVRGFLVFVVDFFEIASVGVFVVCFFATCPDALFESASFGVGVVGALAVIISFGDELTGLFVVDPLGDGLAGVVFEFLPGGLYLNL